MAGNVAVVTGSNKGIGLQIVRNLCAKFDGTVYLTARNEELGRNAVEELKKEGLNPAFHKLDVADEKSVQEFAAFIKEKHGGLDVLVNNAGTMCALESTLPLSEQAEFTLKVNYYGLKNVCDALFPLLRPHARVVTVSSSTGHLKNKVPGEDLRKKFADPNLTEQELDQLVVDYVKSLKDGTHLERGWPTVPYTAYAVTKVAASAVTRIYHQRFLKDPREDLVINHVHPGYVATDLTQHLGPLTVQQGAEAPTYAALLPKNCKSPKGEFIWHTKEVVDWVNGPTPSMY